MAESTYWPHSFETSLKVWGVLGTTGSLSLAEHLWCPAWKAGGGITTDKKRLTLCTALALMGEQLQLQEYCFIAWEQIQGPHLSSHRLWEQHSQPHLPVTWSRVVKPSGFNIPKCTTNSGTWGAKKHPEWVGLKKQLSLTPSSLLPLRLRVECKSNLSYLSLSFGTYKWLSSVNLH